jgi:hypothetical protein
MKFEVGEIVVQDGDKEKVLFPGDMVKITRNGTQIEVKAIDLVESDTLV